MQRNRSAFALFAVLLAACAVAPPAGTGDAPLPAALAEAVDLRGPYRAALCGREDMG
ncbi:MAG: hypothetical protein IT517_10010, partial [Burkholderiales bacterium]|nr:hypothetical protein [Burkholderiales bacterium]